MAQSGAQIGAQTGAQREPSMEEILASIRRIIEDSDSARKPLDEAELPPQLAAVPMPAAPARDVPEIEVAANEVPEVDPEMDIAEREQPESEAPESEVRVFQAELRATTSALDAAWQAEPAPVAPARDADMAPPAATGRAEADEAPSGEGRPVLMSDHAGRQVAAAFGELSEAFAASRRRSFDELAEEMLRPMLQDWLDNNLPTLVERLVREEIERVARGG